MLGETGDITLFCLNKQWVGEFNVSVYECTYIYIRILWGGVNVAYRAFVK